jgi:folate-dependent phosphoribosylglycinamide formyltransferase PurN
MPEKIAPIYAGKPENFHYVSFGSGSGTNIRECAGVRMPSAIFSDRLPYNPLTGKGAKVAETDPTKLKAYDLENLIGVSRIVLNGFKECGPRDSDGYAQRSLRFNSSIVAALHRFEDANNFEIDLIVLGGYMRIVGEPLLKAYPDKIINVHPADLSLLDFVVGLEANWLMYEAAANLARHAGTSVSHDPALQRVLKASRHLIGEEAVYDTIKQGRYSTRSSVIMVDDGVDHGEILTQGASLRVPYEILVPGQEKEFAGKHQGIQKEVSDWPALTTALKLIAEGRLALGTQKNHFDEWRTVYLKDEKGQWKPLPYEGMQVGGK